MHLSKHLVIKPDLLRILALQLKAKVLKVLPLLEYPLQTAPTEALG